MSLIDFFTPVDATHLLPKNTFIKGRLETCIAVFTNLFPDLENQKTMFSVWYNGYCFYQPKLVVGIIRNPENRLHL